MSETRFFDKINGVNLSSSDNKNNIYFEDLNWLVEKINVANSTEKNKNRIEKTFSIVGERGSGKTSCLYTLKSMLEVENYEVLDVIDPNIYGDDLFIIELVISAIYNYLSTQYKQYDKNSKLIEEANNKLEEITKILSSLHISQGKSRAFFISDSLNSEVLLDIANRTQIEIKFTKLFDILNQIGESKNNEFKGFAVLIDDVDLLSNDKVFKMLEHIWKFISRNLITVIAYRADQLYNSIFEQKIEENKTLINFDMNSIEKSISYSELNLQATKYMEKVVPLTNRVHLKHGTELLEMKFIEIIKSVNNVDIEDAKLKLFNDYNLSDEVTTKQWILSVLQQKICLNIYPVDSRENIDIILPNNLRGILQMSDFISNRLEKINVPVDNLSSIRAAVKNIILFEQDIIENKSKELGYEYSELINRWKNQSLSSKNSYIYNEIKRKFFDSNFEEIKNSLFYDQLLSSKVQSYNYCLSDVYVILEILKSKNLNNDSISRFVYVIKLLYSTLLLRQYLGAYEVFLLSEGNEENYKKSLEGYLGLINAHILPDEVFQLNQLTLNINYDNKVDESELKKFGFKDKEEFLVSLNSFVQNFLYSDSAHKGFKSKYSRAKSEKLSLTQRQFYYYNYFEYGEVNPYLTYEYAYNPLTVFTKEKYVIESFNNVSLYFLYSMFDLDVFVRMNLMRQTQENPYEYLLNRIKGLITFSEESSIGNNFNGKISKSKNRNIELSATFSKNFKVLDKVYNMNNCKTIDFTDKGIEKYGRIARILDLGDSEDLSKIEALEILKEIEEESKETEVKEQAAKLYNRLSQPNYKVTKLTKEFISKYKG